MSITLAIVIVVVKLPQPLNIFFISTTLDVLKLIAFKLTKLNYKKSQHSYKIK